MSRPLFHHLGLFASHHAASRRFYTAALEPLGIVEGYASEVTAEYWLEGADTPSFSLETAQGRPTTGLHLAFTAADRAQVDAFHAAAVAAGGQSVHVPRHWEEYGAWCAFVEDPDGNLVEALVKDS